MLSEIERVEIIPGPQSAVHGGGGLAGIISLSTKTDPTDAKRVSIAAEGGSFGSAFLRAKLAIHDETRRARAQIAASFYRTDNIDISPNDGREERDGYDNLTLQARLAHQTHGFAFRASARHLEAKGHYDGTHDGIPNDRLGGDGSYEIRSSLISAELRRQSHALSLSYLRRRDRNTETTNPEITLNKIARATVKAQSSWRVKRGSFAFLAGWELEEFQQIHNRGRREQARQSFFAAETSLVFGEKFFTTFGLRYEDNRAFASSLTWRGTALWRVSAPVLFGAMPLHIRAAYGTAVQNPSLYDLYGFNPGRFAFMPNPDLEPEKGRGFELGADFFPSRDLSFRITYFETILDREIVFNPQRDGPTLANADGESRRRGAELSFRWDPHEALSLQAHYGYVASRDSRGVTELRRPKHHFRAALGWRFFRGFRLHLGALYVSAQRDRIFLSAPPFLRDVSLGGYALFDVKLSADLGGRTFLYVRAENMLDESYEDVVGYATRGVGIFAGLERRF